MLCNRRLKLAMTFQIDVQERLRRLRGLWNAGLQALSPCYGYLYVGI